MKHVTFAALVSAALIGLAGCGDSGPSTTQVKGVVIYRGQPVEQATVMFSPVQEGKGLPAVGQTNAAGEFELLTGNKTGAVPGDYVVAISKTELVPTGEKVPKPEGGVEDVMTSKDLLPPIYKLSSTSPLKVTVEAGKRNEYKFELEDAPQAGGSR
ncbi:MAG: hypothetical protein GYA33_01730 [Thermogutta sp.]|nr:hypothetical protein [Thermogutta sp.]